MKNTQFSEQFQEEYDGDWISECCGAELIVNDQLCGDCKEHADAIPEDDPNFLDEYCEMHPDFNAALNGHPEFI